jgi:uncharacterized membrane protein YfcA
MLLAAVATFAGASVQSATGFGFALVLSPALFAVLDPYEAVTALLALGLPLNLLMLADTGLQPVRWHELAPALSAAVPGLGLGAVVIAVAPKPALQVAVGVAVLGAVMWQLRRRAVDPAPSRGGAGRSGALAGLASGALTTSISLSGPPLVLWLESRRPRPVELRASLAVCFVALNLSGCAVLVASGGIDRAVELELLAPLLLVVLAGHVAGLMAFRRLDGPRFSAVVMAVVAAAGLASVAAGLTAA